MTMEIIQHRHDPEKGFHMQAKPGVMHILAVAANPGEPLRELMLVLDRDNPDMPATAYAGPPPESFYLVLRNWPDVLNVIGGLMQAAEAVFGPTGGPAP